jgi:SPP1 family predicted phage head-tail adaptor
VTALDEMRQRLALEVADEIEDGAGGVARTWEPLGEVWGSLVPLSADDRVTGDRRIGAISHRIVLRHRHDLTLAHRFRLGARIFVVRAIRDPDERGRIIECLALEERP